MLQLVTRTLYGHPVWHADSLDDFEMFLENLHPSELTLFRGQGSDWPLLPRISRDAPKGAIPSIETALLDDFQQASHPYVGSPPDNEWDWMALAQHHGLSTRLLDWTSNAYVALWFAMQRPQRKAAFRPEVWVFQPKRENVIGNKSRGTPLKVPRTQVFVPMPFHPRVKAQDGAFTVFKYMPEYAKGFCELSKNKLLRRHLARIKFPHYHATTIRRKLNKMGYTQSRLFPSLDTTCRQLMRALKAKAQQTGSLRREHQFERYQ